MSINKPMWGVGAVALIAVAAGGYWFATKQAGVASSSEQKAAMATPAGVTLQVIGESRGTSLNGGGNPLAGGVARGLAYANAEGKSFYTYDKDVEAGKSACVGECAKGWPAAVAPVGAVATGDWTLIGRDDGGKQWAYKGKPLYTSIKDAGISEEKGNGADSGVWHTALFQPAAGIGLPDGIGIQEVADTESQAFVNSQGLTLYAYDGDLKNDKPACAAGVCANPWTPLSAPGLANPLGDFSLAVRDDGTKQWAYKGKPLYVYAGDREAGDANGGGVDKRWKVAMLVRHFMPAGVAIQELAGRGKVITTENGLTLYRRETYQWITGGHFLRRGVKQYPSVGRAIGAKCDAECLTTWRPFAAPADAQATGYWAVMTREDGAKQWAYKGYALYTYAGDKKPGDMNGYEIYEYLVNDGVHKVSAPPIPVANATALYWTVVEP